MRNGTAPSGRLSPPSGIGSVYALAVYDDGNGPALYTGGGLWNSDGIAKWDGSTWTPLLSSQNATIFALAVYDDGNGPALYAGGSFTTAGGTANRIAKWDGTAWSPLSGPSGNGMNDKVYALAASAGDRPALYAGGRFSTAGGVAAHRIAKWDGATWSPLSGPSDNGVNDWVRVLTVFDDGRGPALYAGGDFRLAGGVLSSRIAKYSCFVFADGFESGDTSAWLSVSRR